MDFIYRFCAVVRGIGVKGFFLVLGLIAGLASSAIADNDQVFLREEFINLDNWKPLTFPKIKRHSNYQTVTVDALSLLRCQSNNSASGVIYKEKFDVEKFPIVSWRWRVANIYRKGDATKKKGDDYPLRVYIVFDYDPSRVGFLERSKFSAAKMLHGEYPPDSALSYIWANREQAERIITSPYTERAKMIVLQQGAKLLGTWQEQQINILSDYRKAFGKTPPKHASVAIMNDSDNTGESSLSFVDYIEIRAGK